MAPSDSPVATTIDGRTIRLTNLDKVMYPETGTTKQEVLSYYAAVASFLVPHARMRPATRKRFVHGVGTHAQPGKVFFEKNLPSTAPSWIPRRVIEHSDRPVTYPLLNGAAPLVWCAQMAALELHVPQWAFRGDEPAHPDRLVLDLDPGPGADLDSCAEVALLCKAILDDVGLPSVPVTSGSKGLHLYARLDGTQSSQQASAFAHSLALALEADHPKLIVSDMKKSLRGGKVLLDWSQNNAAKTTIAPYSLRGTMRPRVACPRRWDEIAPGLTHLELYGVIERLESDGDPMSELALVDEVEPTVTPKRWRAVGDRSSGSRSSGGRSSGGRSSGGLRPMQASAGTVAQIRGSQWAYEVKWDGYRALVSLADGRLTLTSRNGIDLTDDFPTLQDAAGVFDAASCLLDGEIVALDESGRPRFDRLHSGGDSVQLMLFDVLEVDGESWVDREYRDRRARLESLIGESTLAHVPPQLGGTADEALATSAQLRLEGIVAKRLTSRYLPGVRSASWVKIKHVRTQEAVVVGWSPGVGNRAGTIGSLLLAVVDDGALRYVGKVGSGFDDRELREAAVRLAAIERDEPALDDVPADESKGAHWVEPKYVAEVRFGEWTESGRLRHPVWKGWRRDKDPADVVRE